MRRALRVVFEKSAITLLALAFLGVISQPLAILADASTAATFFAPLRFAHGSGGASKELAEAASLLSDLDYESTHAQFVIRIFNLLALRREAFRFILTRCTSWAIARTYICMIPRAANFALGLTRSLVLGSWCYLGSHGRITNGNLIAFIGFTFQIGEAVNNITTRCCYSLRAHGR